MPPIDDDVALLQAVASANIVTQTAAAVQLRAFPQLLANAQVGVSGAADVSAATVVINNLRIQFAAATVDLLDALAYSGTSVAPTSVTPVSTTPTSTTPTSTTFALYSTPMNLTTVQRASRIRNSVGLNLHKNYTDGGYRASAGVNTNLLDLGIYRARDTALNPGDQGQNEIKSTMQAGIGQIVYMRLTGGAAAEVTRLVELANAAPGMLLAIEGPNEPNNSGLGNVAANNYLAEIIPLIKANATLANIPIAGVASFPSLYTPNTDLINIHPYDRNGEPSRAAIQNDLNAAYAAGYPTNTPFLIGETGHHTTPVAQADWEALDEATQAKYILTTICIGLNMGAHGVYLYEMLDQKEDIPGTEREQHFGLYTYSATDSFPKKPSATALKNFMAVLADAGGTADTFTPTQLSMSVNNAPAEGRSFVVQKSNNEYVVVTWNEVIAWNKAAHTPITISATNQTVNFGATFANVEVYDPIVGATAVQTATNASSIVVGLTDHPLLIKLFN